MPSMMPSTIMQPRPSLQVITDRAQPARFRPVSYKYDVVLTDELLPGRGEDGHHYRDDELPGSHGLATHSMPTDDNVNCRRSVPTIFGTFDRDRSGELDKREFQAAIGQMGIRLSEFQIKEVMAEIDMNVSGSIDAAEFMVKDPRSPMSLATFEFPSS